jgi:hypothetical protein
MNNKSIFLQPHLFSFQDLMCAAGSRQPAETATATAVVAAAALQLQQLAADCSSSY